MALMTMARHRWLALATFAACILALGVAYGAETFLGLVPCAFCLLERWPYRICAGLALLAFVLPRRAGLVALWLVVPVLIGAVGLSFVHTGVEQHWWPDPLPECTTANLSGMTMAQRLAAMPARPAKPCEDPDFLISGVPISVTQMGLAYALAISAGLSISLIRNKGRTLR